ncbi:MAG: hypothetical protein ACK5SX_12895 [Sandaracinobacter sp.]
MTFNGPLGDFKLAAFPASSRPMIAPCWGDVDTRNLASGRVYIGTLGDADGFDIFGWDGSGYTIFLGTAADGGLFNFEAGGISRFGLCGIDVGLGWTPTTQRRS